MLFLCLCHYHICVHAFMYVLHAIVFAWIFVCVHACVVCVVPACRHVCNMSVGPICVCPKS